MPDKNDFLNELAEARRNYPTFLAAVEEDLAREKERRLAGELGNIRHLIAQAYIAGASISAIMRAYNTTDFRTIKNIITSMESQIAEMRRKNDEPESDWFHVINDHNVIVEGDYYFVIHLEDEEFMLDSNGGPWAWDGRVLEPQSTTNEEKELYWAIYEAGKEAAL